MLFISRKYMENRGFHLSISDDGVHITCERLRPIGKEISELTELNDANVDAVCQFINKLQVVQAIMEQ